MALDSVRSVLDGIAAVEQWHRASLTPEERAREDRDSRNLAFTDTLTGMAAVGFILSVWASPFVVLWLILKR